MIISCIKAQSEDKARDLIALDEKRKHKSIENK